MQLSTLHKQNIVRLVYYWKVLDPRRALKTICYLENRHHDIHKEELHDTYLKLGGDAYKLYINV